MYNSGRMTVKIISIEGNIGSGKSTLLENLRNCLSDRTNVFFLKEPVDEWEQIRDENGVTMLEKFYSNQEKYSFSFQMMAYITRLKVLRETLSKIDATMDATIITERSLNTDKMVFAKMLYDSGKIEHINHQVYLSWFDMFATELPISKTVYVKTSPEICHKRIQKRSRTGEENISLEYLKECDAYHDNMISDCIDNIVLDGNIDIYESQIQLALWIQKIVELM